MTIVLLGAMCAAGCGGGSRAAPSPRAAIARRPPVAPCSLLTAREVSAVLAVKVRRLPSRAVCTYQGTRDGVFHGLLVTPQSVRVTPPVPFTARNGSVRQIGGRGYHGEAQEDPPSQGAAGLDQASAQVISGEVIVRLLVTYRGPGLRGVPQAREVAVLADRVGRRLARRR